ncbi:hypothetical protein [Nostoc sp.]|uniref:hypothetical protein n=1 Tax=Nostoc sp. TaxID=1180 RepID=UPI003FA5EF33
MTTTEIENFFAKLKQYRAMPKAGYAYATRYKLSRCNLSGCFCHLAQLMTRPSKL